MNLKKMTVADETATITLRQIVKETLQNYFSNIGNDKPVEFYHIFMEEIERPMLDVLINYTHYNQVKMAQILGISRGTLRKKLKQYGLLD